MKESNFQMIDNMTCKSTDNKFISKNLVNYIFKKYANYIGRQNSAIFFRKYNYNIDQIIIQQFFALNGQMKIQKKWWIEIFQNIAFMHKSNQFITSTKSKIFINNIESYIYCQDEHQYLDVTPQCSFFLVLSENDNLIVAFIQTTIYFLIKEDNGNWMLQQRERLGFDTNYLIQGYQLNDEGNILIIYFSQPRHSVHFLTVFLKVDGLWKKIKEFHFEFSSLQFCFFDDQKFLILSDENHQTKLSIFQIFSKTFEVKLLQTQDFQIQGIFFKLRFLTKRGFFVAWKSPFGYVIQQVNKEFKVTSQMRVSQDLMFSDIINEEFLVFNSSQFCGNIHKTQVSKFYEK